MPDSHWTSAHIPPQAGRRILVTGANSGLGYHTALELARAGAEVTLAGRAQARLDGAASLIRAAVPHAQLRTALLDLADPASVHTFAAAELALSRPLDVLIHNAGVMALPQRLLSPDGHELQFATNVLGPYRLTALLLPALLRAPAPRVVTVSSNTHKAASAASLDQLDDPHAYRPIPVYAATKLANILFTRELQRRAAQRLLAVSCHPGAARTNLAAASSLLMKVACVAFYPLMQSAAMGAEPTLLAATATGLTPGGYYGPGGLLEWSGHPVESTTSPLAADPALALHLFERLESLTGLRLQF